MDKLNEMLAAIRDKLNTPTMHIVLAIALAVISTKTPDAYQWIPDMLLTIFAAMGVTLSVKQKAKVMAFEQLHAQTVDTVLKIAADTGINVDTSALEQAAAHPAIQPKAPPGTP